MKKPSVFVVFLTVFIDLIGFGIVLPLLPIYSRDFHAPGWLIGVIMASFSLMQFFFAPSWGRLSDRIGRRPVLLVSTAGASASYVLFALGSGLKNPQHALMLLLLSRAFAGICGANITVAQAYIADITPPEKRSARMGLIGMAFGLGFVVGPWLGGVSAANFGITAPGWVAAVMCALNFFLTLAILPESWKPSSEHVAARPQLAQWLHTLNQPSVGLLVVLFFLATFCFTCFETTLGLLVEENFRLDTSKGTDARFISYLFAYCGIIGAVVQGGLIGRLVKQLGEAKIILGSFLLVAVSLAMLPYLAHIGVLLLGLALLSTGSAIARPPIFGLISVLTPAHEQGATIGVAQSAGSLARIIGPVFAATLFDSSPAAPYLICAAVSLVAGIVTWQGLCKSPQAAMAGKTQSAG